MGHRPPLPSTSAEYSAYYGLDINTDAAVIDHNNFSYNNDGLVLYNSDAVVSNNTFYWNDMAGVYALIYSNATIENNVFESNKVYGIWVDGGGSTNPRGANPLIRNNRIRNTGRGSTTAVGVQIVFSSSPRLENNTILKSTEDAIYAGENCKAIINNTVIDGARYAIATSSVGHLEVWNASIANISLYHVSVSGGQVNLLNTSINRSKVSFADGRDGTNLTLNYFLHISVNDSAGHPIPNATVHITDNANGTYDRNFTTDGNGRVDWIVLKDYWQNRSTTINYSNYTVSVGYPGVSFIDNNRSVKMNISRTEYFTEPRTAAATGPTSTAPCNIDSVTITYTNSTNTSSVGLYYTADNGTTWTFIGNDTDIDGSYAWTIPADGTYGWTAVGDDESAPTSGDKPEAFPYIYDGTAPDITGTDPVDAAVNVSVNRSVTINFSEPITPPPLISPASPIRADGANHGTLLASRLPSHTRILP